MQTCKLITEVFWVKKKQSTKQKPFKKASEINSLNVNILKSQKTKLINQFL